MFREKKIEVILPMGKFIWPPILAFFFGASLYPILTHILYFCQNLFEVFFPAKIFEI